MGMLREKAGSRMRFLLVEDTADVAETIIESFSKTGHVVEHATTLADAGQFSDFNEYDLVILDVNLPDGMGLELLKRLRSRGNPVPVLVLTARLAIDDRIGALDLGADDYMVKPFDLGELQARVRALLRRRSGNTTAVLEAGRLRFDMTDRTVTVSGEPRELTRREQVLLEIFLTKMGRVLDKQELLTKLFGLDAENSENAVELYVGRLRRKIEGSGLEIKTLRGLGYQARVAI